MEMEVELGKLKHLEQHMNNKSIYDATIDTLYFQKHDPIREELLVVKEIHPQDTLVQYFPPVAFGYEKRNYTIRFFHAVKHSSGYAKMISEEVNNSCQIDKEFGERSGTELFIQKVFPTLEWLSDHYFWRQKVSTKLPNPRIDDVLLDNEFLSRLKERNAKSTFVSEIRREIYDQCFDEILRRTLLTSPTRGVLLLQCRDELRTCLKSKINLFQSHMAFNVRNSMRAEHCINLVAEKKEQNGVEKVALLLEKESLMQKIKSLRDQWQAKQELIRLKSKAELESVKNQNTLLKKQLRSMTDPTNVVVSYSSITQTNAE